MSRLTSSQTGTSVELEEAVNRSFKIAREMMARAGFNVPSAVRVSIDPNLPFMGYTMPRGQSFNIVVSGGAVESGMLEGLLVHEMSHIYRIEAHHPSHNAQILEEAVQKVAGRIHLHDYQAKILHDLLNDIQDLYADDIALKVFRKTPTSVTDLLSGFFQSMVIDQPVKTGNPLKDNWANASILAHNARAIGQMTRHRIEDSADKAARANQIFLAKLPPAFTRYFDFFRRRLTNMKETITQDEYRALLAEHLDQFMEIAERK